MHTIPKYVFDVDHKIKAAGYESYLVGGSLRDILLDTEPNDYDLATNASPEKISQLFRKSILTGAHFGTVRVLIYDEHEELHTVEVTTYRKEKDYVGGRWPSHVEFTSSLIEDLSRRDFTVNALALNLNSKIDKLTHPEEIKKYLKNNLVDYYDGLKDLENKIIRAVGDPYERFKEDGLRCMRACRLASVLGFKVEKNTIAAIPNNIDTASIISKERVRDELVKLIENSPDPSYGIKLMKKAGLLTIYLPELLEGYGMEQNKYHTHDVFHHILSTVDVAPKEVRLAALFHDIGKPRCKVGATFYAHDIVGAEMTRKILQRLKFPSKDTNKISQLVRWHMFFFPISIKNGNEQEKIKTSDENCKNTKKAQKLKKIKNQTVEKVYNSGYKDGAIRRLIRNVGGYENIDDLLKLRIADSSGNPKASFDPSEVFYLSQRIAKLQEQESMLSVKDLKVDGYDLMYAGIPEGPILKEVLDHLLEYVTDHIDQNKKEILLKEAERYYSLTILKRH